MADIAPPPPPSGYRWIPPEAGQPMGGPATNLTHPTSLGGSMGGYGPQVRPPHTQSKKGARGAAGTAAAGAGAVAKYGILAAKFGKIALSMGTMLISMWVLALAFGPFYGVGIVLLIAVHETGHMLMARREGVPASLPYFLGPFGALITVRQRQLDLRQMAMVAIGGPLLGTIGALAVWLYATSMTPSHTQSLLFALAYTGCFLNLFNLIPYGFLDGGRISAALSPWSAAVGVVLMAGFAIWEYELQAGLSPILVIILLLGGISTWGRFRAMRRGTLPPLPPAASRWFIGLAYLGVALLAAAGMSEAHLSLLNGGYISN